MKNKRIFIFGIILLFIIIMILKASAQENVYCCEKTTFGDWCRESLDQSTCDSSYRISETSCESTSYCKKGTCVDTEEGICYENTPKTICEGQEEISGGVWYSSSKDDVPLCQEGCCLIGDQAAFVTLTRCQVLSSVYGLEINFQANVQSELQCIAMASPKAKGACVIETDTGRTCRFTTKKECSEIPGEFHEGFLCSNPDLGTNCGMTQETTCLEGRNEVYFVDSCGNPANVYDSSKINDVNYWSYVAGTRPGVEVDCGDGEGNKGSSSCGDCDYLLGSTCGTYRTGIESKPKYGNLVCRNLDCVGGELAKTFKSKYGRYPKHGETWCGRVLGDELELGGNPGISVKDGKLTSFSKLSNLPGVRDFRFVCYNGEVTVEPCADYRQEICVEDEYDLGEGGIFKSGSCRKNYWEDCYTQDNKKDCESEDRDCVWVEGASVLKDENGRELKLENDKLVPGDSSNGASCIPKYTPGFNFWEEGYANDICSLADTACVVVFKKGLISGTWKVDEKNTPKQCQGVLEDFKKKTTPKIVDSWETERINLCSALGDCGISENYIGVEGYYDKNNLFTITEGDFSEEEEE